jgi:hypothetical protein
MLSDSPEVAWRANDVLEQIGITGDEETLEMVSKALAEVSRSSKHSLAKSTSQVQIRWKRLRHERAVAQIAKLGGEVRGGADGDLVAFGGGFGVMPAVAFDAVPVEVVPLIEEVEEDLVPEKIEAPAEAPAVDEGELPEAPVRPARLKLAAPFGAIPFAPKLELLPVVPVPADVPAEEDLDLDMPFKDPGPRAPAKGFFGKIFRAFEDILPVIPPADMELPDVEEFAPVEAAEAIELVPDGIGFAGLEMIDDDSPEGDGDGAHVVKLGKEWKGGVEGFKLLKDVNHLTALELHELDVTDAHVGQLGQLAELRQLNLQRCRFDRAAVEKLKLAKPELTVLAYGEAVMGISGQAQGEGFHITFVAPNSGAQAAGLQVDDVVLRISGEALKSFEQLTHVVASRKIGDKIAVEVLRQGKKLSLDVTLKARDAAN